MIYKCTKNCPPDPAVKINDVQVPQVHEVIHLGHKLSDDTYKYSSTKCVEDFNRQSNIFLANFKHANSNIRNALFQNYCTSFCVNGLYSVLGANYRVLCTKYGMNLNNIMKVWNERCANEKEIIR